MCVGGNKHLKWIYIEVFLLCSTQREAGQKEEPLGPPVGGASRLPQEGVGGGEAIQFGGLGGSQTSVGSVEGAAATEEGGVASGTREIAAKPVEGFLNSEP